MNEAQRRLAGREWKRGEWQTALGLWFGAEPAQSDTSVRARLGGRPPGGGRSGAKMA